MTHPCDNRLVVGKNDAHFMTHFGMPYNVYPKHHVHGRGHAEQLEIACHGGFALEVSWAFAIELERRLHEAIARRPIEADDVRDAVGGQCRMSVNCGTCGVSIERPPKMPLQVIQENGRPALVADNTAIYEHIRDVHPEQWTDAMAVEFENVHDAAGGE